MSGRSPADNPLYIFPFYQAFPDLTFSYQCLSCCVLNAPFNLDEQIISKFIIAFNQASILYESIKDNTFLTNLEKFNNDSELFEEYYVTFLDNYDYWNKSQSTNKKIILVQLV